MNANEAERPKKRWISDREYVIDANEAEQVEARGLGTFLAGMVDGPVDDLARAILASPWLADQKRQAGAAVLREAADALDRRAGEFRHLPGDRHVRRTHADIATWLRARARAERLEAGDE